LNDLKSQNAGMTFTGSLGHFKHLDERYAVRIASHEQHAPDILRLLQSLGCARTCYAVSENSELDGKQLSLAKALKEVVGYGTGTFLPCIPGRLGYFEDEVCRWILERRP
jgi:hypothetical protein